MVFLKIIKAKKMRSIKKHVDQNLQNLFRQTILHYNVVSINRIFWFKKVFFFLFKRKIYTLLINLLM